VTDNGTGIEEDDVAKALLRHATSKIKEASDLFRIRTLGFRGEALPSIASVSELTIETQAQGASRGTRLLAKGGQIENEEPFARAQGTTIQVRNLFYNTPARLKFVKSLQAELAAATDVINRQILAHPEVAFELLSEGKLLVASTGSGDLKQAIAGVYGMQTARKMIAIHASDLDFEVSGYVCLPELTRASRNYTTLLINQRYVKRNFILQKAVLEGYGRQIMVGRFPIAVIDMRMDPQLPDVNVHPAKEEIRLSKEKELHDLIVKAIQEALKDDVQIPKALENLGGSGHASESSFNQPKTLAKENYNEIYDPKRFVQEELFVHEPPASAYTGLQETGKVEASQQQTAPAHIQQPEDTNGVLSEQKKASFPELQYLAQLHRTYLLCEAADGLYIVDQHAAAERVNLEKWQDKIGDVSFEQQQLLAPIVVDLPKNDFLKLSENLEKLLEAGVSLTEYGESQYILREHPVWMGNVESELYELIDLVLAGEKASVADLRKDLAIMISCKSAIKANMPIDPEGARDLLRQLAECEDPYHCAHGRPAVVKFDNTDLQKMFRRIMQSHGSARENQV
jgi:DNA mismatch repair protein MutL